jgi:hypothetical protein
MSAASQPVPFGSFEDIYVLSSGASADADPPYTESATRSRGVGISRFGSFAAPFAVAAALFAPAPPTTCRRVFFSGEASGSGAIDLYWDLDDVWTYSQARTTQAEIDELNALYVLSPRGGFSLELPDA